MHAARRHGAFDLFHQIDDGIVLSINAQAANVAEMHQLPVGMEDLLIGEGVEQTFAADSRFLWCWSGVKGVAL